VLAAGGRYDALVKSFENPLINRRNKMDGETVLQPTVVGGSIYLDKVVTLMKNLDRPDERVLITAAICTVGYRPQSKEQASLVRDLWNAGVRATVLDHCQVGLFKQVNYTEECSI